MSNVNNQNQLNTDMIPDGEIILVSGVVEFSHIKSRIEGKDLEDDNARKVKNGMIPEDKPHTRLSISNASISYQDPTNISIGEQYIESRFFNSPKNPQKGLCYEGKSKSLSLPDVFVRDANDPSQIQMITPEGELASGLKVTIILRCFGASKPGMHKGIALEGVICEEPPRYYVGGINAATLSALQNRGFTVKPASVENIESQKNNLAAVASTNSGSAVATPVQNDANVPTPPVYGAVATASAPSAYPGNYATPPVSNVVPPVYPAQPGAAVYPPPNVNGVNLP